MATRLQRAVVRNALEELANTVQLRRATGPDSHSVMGVEGLEEPPAIAAVATYLLACLAGAVRVDVSLASRLLGAGVDPKAELRRRVSRCLGADNDWSEDARKDWRDRRRNPWIAEGIAHALLVITENDPTGCIEGSIAALKPLHAQVTQQGLDIVGIYTDEADALWLAIGECKATESGPSQALTDATGFFRTLEAGERDGELVGDLLILEPVLEPDALDDVGESLWLGRRTYLPLVAYHEKFDASAQRPAMLELQPMREHKRVLLVELEEFHSFFDEVAEEARRRVSSVLG